MVVGHRDQRMIPQEYELEDKTVIISGAARGVGNGIATGGIPDLETNPPEVIAWQKEFARKHVPLGGRYGELREVGLTALFLASDASSFMTGEMLYLDGGMSRIHGVLT